MAKKKKTKAKKAKPARPKQGRRGKPKKRAANKKPLSAADRKTMRSPGEIIHTQAEAAAYMGCTRRCLRRYVNERGMPTVTVDDKRCYVKGVLDQWKQNEGQAEDPASRRRVAADAEFKETRTQIAKLELGERKRELGSIAEMERANVRKVVAIRRGLLGLGRKLAPRVSAIKDPRKNRKLIDDEVKAIIGRFAGDK